MARSVLIRIVAVGVVLGPAAARAQGVDCAKFLLEHDGSWRSFTTDEMLLPRGPVPIHEGERFSRDDSGPRGFIARILDAQCRPGGSLY